MGADRLDLGRTRLRVHGGNDEDDERMIGEQRRRRDKSEGLDSYE
jgi:hypothetical protein